MEAAREDCSCVLMKPLRSVPLEQKPDFESTAVFLEDLLSLHPERSHFDRRPVVETMPQRVIVTSLTSKDFMNKVWRLRRRLQVPSRFTSGIINIIFLVLSGYIFVEHQDIKPFSRMLEYILVFLSEHQHKLRDVRLWF